jgi:hypothetical protein
MPGGGLQQWSRRLRRQSQSLLISNDELHASLKMKHASDFHSILIHFLASGTDHCSN